MSTSHPLLVSTNTILRSSTERIKEPTRDTLLRADKHLKNPYSTLQHIHNIGGVRTLLGSTSTILKAIYRRITQPIRNTLFNNLSTSKTPTLFCSTYIPFRRITCVSSTHFSGQGWSNVTYILLFFYNFIIYWLGGKFV